MAEWVARRVACPGPGRGRSAARLTVRDVWLDGGVSADQTPRLTVREAVDYVFGLATADEARSLDGLFAAIARDRGRPLEIHADPRMPAGVFGQWLRFADHDEVAYAAWVPTPERTLAHELGHIVFGHRGRPVAELAEAAIPSELQGMAALMLRRECGSDTAAEEELAAEQFASLLLSRLHSMGRQRDPGLRSRWGEALG